MSSLLSGAPRTIDTERLNLRIPEPGDGVVVNAAIRDSADSLRAWMDWMGEDLPSVEETEERCLWGRGAYGRGEHLPYLAFIRESGQFVGRCDLHITDAAVPSFMTGYWVNRPFEGQGYVTESVRALLALAFGTLQANRVWLSCSTLNVRSRRVAERCGFRLEGELRNERRMPDGALRHTLIYGMTPDEHRALAK